MTRILQPSLSGNARIAIICTISLSPVNYEETQSTLKFATRAKKIKNIPKLNETVDDKALIKQYQIEIALLKKKLEEAQNAEKQLEELHFIRKQKEKVEEDNEIMSQKLREQQIVVAGLQERIRQLTKVILSSSSVTTKPQKHGVALSTSPGNQSSMGLSDSAILVVDHELIDETEEHTKKPEPEKFSKEVILEVLLII